MNMIDEVINITQNSSYGKAFWDSMRTDRWDVEILNKGKAHGVSAYFAPEGLRERIRKEVAKCDSLRAFASSHKHYKGHLDFLSAANEDYAEFIADGEMIPGYDMTDDFTKMCAELHKAAVLVKAPTEFVYDASFDIEGYLAKSMAKAFVRAEDKAFINGTGVNEPTGLLHDTNGAEVAASVDTITYDSIIDLFFSVKPEYRKNAVWIMNDATALVLRKLKDKDGNYLWNQASDTILGKKVVISNEMPDAESGKKPVIFGDISYYWIVDRSPISIKALKEVFAANDQIGYVGYEFLDARLVRSEAVKVLEIK